MARVRVVVIDAREAVHLNVNKSRRDELIGRRRGESIRPPSRSSNYIEPLTPSLFLPVFPSGWLSCSNISFLSPFFSQVPHSGHSLTHCRLIRIKRVENARRREKSLALCSLVVKTLEDPAGARDLQVISGEVAVSLEPAVGDWCPASEFGCAIPVHPRGRSRRFEANPDR